VRNFVVFDTESGKTVRKACRYKQLVAVNRALERIKRAKKPTERGGVVWHTQGSGKSLTMLWLALKLRRDPRSTTPRWSSSPIEATSIARSPSTFAQLRLRQPRASQQRPPPARALSGPTGKTITTTVQKFLELTAAGPAVRLSAPSARRTPCSARRPTSS
jgi:type I restriction enzyme R subunit